MPLLHNLFYVRILRRIQRCPKTGLGLPRLTAHVFKTTEPVCSLHDALIELTDAFRTKLC